MGAIIIIIIIIILIIEDQFSFTGGHGIANEYDIIMNDFLVPLFMFLYVFDSSMFLYVFGSSICVSLCFWFLYLRFSVFLIPLFVFRCVLVLLFVFLCVFDSSICVSLCFGSFRFLYLFLIPLFVFLYVFGSSICVSLCFWFLYLCFLCLFTFLARCRMRDNNAQRKVI